MTSGIGSIHHHPCNPATPHLLSCLKSLANSCWYNFVISCFSWFFVYITVLLVVICSVSFITHSGLLMKSYGNTELNQITLVQVMAQVACRHLAISWTNVDLSSVRSNDISNSSEGNFPGNTSAAQVSLKITLSKILFPSARNQWVEIKKTKATRTHLLMRYYQDIFL